MQVSATYNGGIVNILDVTGNNNDVFITYVDSSNNLLIKKQQLITSAGYFTDTLIIATSATII